ncbi:MAG: hypothetical protein QM820_58735 [Minicystis sp.]
MRLSSAFILAIATGIFAVACNSPIGFDDALEQGEAVDSAKQPLLSSLRPKPPAGMNGKSPACFWDADTQQAYRLLGREPLNQSNGKIMNLRSLITERCYTEALENAIECALPEGTTVRDSSGQEFHGWWGLAPSWLDNPLDTDGARWVTGCMAQRLNGTGTTIEILLGGATPPLGIDEAWQALMPYDESTAYGDVFNVPDGTTAQIYVCWSDDADQQCAGTGCTPEEVPDLRICDRSSVCGLTVVGKCTDVCTRTDSSHPWMTCPMPDGSQSNHTVHVRLEHPY